MQSMKILIALAASATAFVAPNTVSVPTARFSEEGTEVAAPAPSAPSGNADAAAFAELKELQNSMAGPPGFYDPLGLSEMSFKIGLAEDDGARDVGQAATIGWLRHSEIKHGRVAMAAFLGYIAQCTPLVSGEHKFLPYSGYVAGVTPQEQWDNIPLYGKLQILVFVGMLESYGEGAGNPKGYVHYMQGGKPGFFPEIAGRGGPGIDGGEGAHFVLNLWDPLNFQVTKKRTEEQNARGRKSEILNGRAAMFGIMGLLAESKVPGSVPFIEKLAGANFPHYAGDVMAPFSNDFPLNLSG